MSAKTMRHEDAKAELLSDPEVRRADDELEPTYQVARLRIMRGMTQQDVARNGPEATEHRSADGERGAG